jgi:hypothetical protein
MTFLLAIGIAALPLFLFGLTLFLLRNSTSAGAVWAALGTTLVLTVLAVPAGAIGGWLLVGDGHGWPHETEILSSFVFGPAATILLVGGGFSAWLSSRRA